MKAKRRISVLIGVLLCLCAIGWVGASEAESGAGPDDDPIKVQMELSTNRFNGPREITVTIRVTNTGESAMPGPVELFYPNGKQVMEFGEPVLGAGESQTWTGQWWVTQAQLDAGRLPFTIQYTFLNGDGQVREKTLRFSKKLYLESETPQVSVTRTISPAVASEGQTVIITYEIANTGKVDIRNVRITEDASISATPVSIARIAAGETNAWTFSATMGTDGLTSSAVIRYEALGKEYTDRQEAVAIPYHRVDLTAELTADKKGVYAGEDFRLTLTLTNNGTMAYRNITASDPALGTVVSGLTLEAGESRTVEKILTIENTAAYRFTVTAEDAGGVEVSITTERLTVTAIRPSETASLSITIAADPEGWRLFPGSVAFTVSVTNHSDVKAEKVAVYVAGSKYRIYTFPDIEPGETRSFTREIYCSMTGTYQFQARVVNQLGETMTFDSNRVHITLP